MTEANAASDPTFAVSQERPEVVTTSSRKDDPPFAVSDHRPEIILNRRGLIVSVGSRATSPLTNAVLSTLRQGGSVIVPFDEDSHKRLGNRFGMLQQRVKAQRIVFRHSFVFEEGKAEATGVQWWCEQLTPEEKREEDAAAAPPPPPEEKREPVVGRDVE